MIRRTRAFAAAFLAACLLAPLCLLAACGERAQSANPALWEVEGAAGQRGWLFGTIHSAPQPLAWKTGPVSEALAQADEIVVEVGNIADDTEVAATFARLARASGKPPLSQRVPAEQRADLAGLLEQTGHEDGDFSAIDTWAAALTLARGTKGSGDARNGVDRAVIALAGKRPVIELEGATTQLGLFDALPEREQRDLLVAVIEEAGHPETDLSQSWRSGDMAAIEAETRRGLLADPELRAVLFTGRNRAWTKRIAQRLDDGHHPFVAVGAAHMAGPDGLVAMLRTRGYTVTRIE